MTWCSEYPQPEATIGQRFLMDCSKRGEGIFFFFNPETKSQDDTFWILITTIGQLFKEIQQKEVFFGLGLSSVDGTI